MADSEVTPTTREDLRGLIETDAQIQPGDSGGPLVNTLGQVVGMDTAALASSAGGSPIGFAIPINQAIDIARNIEEGVISNGIVLGTSAFMGVFVEPVPDFRAAQGGFGVPCGAGPSSGSTSNLPVAGEVVVKVLCGGPAVAAGIVPGDTIVAVDGSAVTNNETSLSVILARLKPGETARVKIVSESGATSTLAEPLGAQPT
jgi:S1-C subfamily serine protease